MSRDRRPSFLYSRRRGTYDLEIPTRSGRDRFRLGLELPSRYRSRSGHDDLRSSRASRDARGYGSSRPHDASRFRRPNGRPGSDFDSLAGTDSLAGSPGRDFDFDSLAGTDSLTGCGDFDSLAGSPVGSLSSLGLEDFARRRRAERFGPDDHGWPRRSPSGQRRAHARRRSSWAAAAGSDVDSLAGDGGSDDRRGRCRDPAERRDVHGRRRRREEGRPESHHGRTRDLWGRRWR